MLYVRREFGDEKSQLNELNRRLDQYLSRVRQLEEENHLLVEEIQRLRLGRGSECAQRYHSEISQLRKKVEELTVETCEAEIQKQNLSQELQNLKELWEQVRAMRHKIDQELEFYKQDLQQAQRNQANLEELYFRLQQECQMLQGSQHEELLALRDQALQIPLKMTMHEVVRPRLNLTDVQSLSLELSESWKDTFVLYQKKIEELECSLRLSEEERLEEEENVRIHRLQIEELRREYEELMGIQKILEDDLLRMKERYRVEVEEYEIIIEELESEKQTITVTITERLKDYHDLMQVKTGLSLEVAAYRALLEAENKKDTVIWTEHSFRDRPAGYVTSTLDESTRLSHRGGKMIEYPITRSNEEIRRNPKTTNTNRFLTRTVPATQIRSQYTNLGNTSSSYVSHVNKIPTPEKSGRWDMSTLSRYDLFRNTELPQTSYRTVKPAISTPHSASQSTFIIETSKQEQIKDLKPVARPRTHSKEARKGHVDMRTEDSQVNYKNKETEERKIASNSVEEKKQVSDISIKYVTKDDTASVTETIQKDTNQEYKSQELPVKKERKKREQAKKRKDEEEKVGEVNVQTVSKVETNEITHGKESGALEAKPEHEQMVFEIPIQFEARKNESSQISNRANKTTQNVRHTYVNEETDFHIVGRKTDDAPKTSSEDRTHDDDIFKYLGKSVVDEIETNMTSSETKQRGSGSRTIVFGEQMPGEPKVLEIPIHLEVSKRELSSKVDDAEQSSQRNERQTHVSEEVTFQRTEGMHKSSKHMENKESNKSENSEEIDSSSEMGKKAMVADILRQLGQPSALDDTNVTYVEKKEQCGDGYVKTEITVQSRIKEELDLFDEPDLTDLWNTTTTQASQKTGEEISDCWDEEFHSRKIKKTVLEEVSGAEAEKWIGNIVHTGLSGSPGKSVNVEIVEECYETFGYEKEENATPFHIEEAEDNYNAEESICTDEHASAKHEEMQDEIQITEGPTQVEEVTEGENVDEEINYFVSIPDDNPFLEEEEEETLRGQIHTEEESHVKYSWQDEFLQGSQGRKTLSEFVKQATFTEPSTTSHVVLDNSSGRLNSEEQKDESHSETIVIEKKITVPHEIRSSLMDFLAKDVKDPQEKLKGTLDCLQGSLPQDLVDELSTLTGEEQTQVSSLALDIKKVGQTEESGVVTIVAEINLSQTIDIDNLDELQLNEGVRTEETIHKPQLKSFEDLSSFQLKEREGVSVTKECIGSEDWEDCYSSDKISQQGTKTTSVHFNPTRELPLDQFSANVNSFIKQVELSSHELNLQGESVTDQGSSDDLSPTEMTRSEHHIRLGPSEMLSTKQIIFEGPISQTLKLDLVKNTEDKSDQNISIRHIKISPTEKYPTEQIVFQGPIFKMMSSGANITGDVSTNESYIEETIPNLLSEKIPSNDQENTSQSSEFISGTNKTVSHFNLNSGQTLNREIIFEGSIPRDNDVNRNITFETRKSEDDSKPIEYNFAAQKIHVAKQVKYHGFVSDPYQVDSGEHVASNEQSSVNTSVHHIKLSPSREQIVFEGHVSPNLHFSGEGSSLSEESNRSTRFIRLGSPDMHKSEYVTFEGPITESYESSDFALSSPSGESSESERSIKHIKLGPAEKSFTFQMDITKIAKKYSGGEGAQDSGLIITSRKFEGQPELSQLSSELTDDTEVAESGYGEEEIAGVSQLPYSIMSNNQSTTDMSELDKTVQLQRIVHQSHVVSDDKKVAVVYLDEEEESDQDYLRRSF